jgi:hypothetical protein
MRKASELHDKLVEELKEVAPEGDFTTQCLFQPLPKLFADRSVKSGGNVMGMQNHQHDGILFLDTTMMKTAEQEAFAYPRVKQWIEGVRAFANTIDGGNLSWLHLNYADKTQDVLGSYGPESEALLWKVTANMTRSRYFRSFAREVSNSSRMNTKYGIFVRLN